MCSVIPSSKRAADVTLVAACVVQLLTIRDGQPWGDDFAQYITHARNLVELRPYGDIGVLPAGAFLGPREYPPVFPLMLAPVYYFFGPSLPALKVVGIVSLMLALLIFRRLFETTLVGGYLVAWAMLVGFHPYLHAFASMVLSDQAFMLWTAAALLALDRWGDTKAPPRTAALRGCIVGMLIALSVETRTIGVALVPALALIALRRRTSWHFTATALATASFLIATTIVLVPEQFQHGARVADMHVVRHAQLYWAYLTSFFPGFNESSAQATLSALRQQAGLAPVFDAPGPSKRTLVVAALALGIVAVAGFFLSVRRGLGPVEVFVCAYMPIVIVFPILQGARFVMPLLPILFAYLIGAVASGRLERHRWGRIVLGTALLAGLLLHGRGLASTSVADEYGNDETTRLLDFIRTSTPADAVIEFAKPRALYLMTGRTGFCPVELPDEKLWDEFEAQGVTHVVLGGPKLAFLEQFAKRFPERLTPVYASKGFTVLSIARRPK